MPILDTPMLSLPESVSNKVLDDGISAVVELDHNMHVPVYTNLPGPTAVVTVLYRLVINRGRALYYHDFAGNSIVL